MGAPVTGIDPRIGFAFQTDALFPWRSVIDNVVAGPLFRGVPNEQAYAKAREWLARVHLSGHESKYPHQLSGVCASACRWPRPSSMNRKFY